MNNNYKILIYILSLTFSSIAFSSKTITLNKKNIILLNKSNFNNLCTKLKDFENNEEELKNLNAYDRSEEKIKIKKEKKEFLNSYYIIKLTSSEFELGDYIFSNSYFEVKNIKLNSGIKIELATPIHLNIEKENAKMIAAKKELGILDLYLKVKLKELLKLSSNQCNSDKEIIKIKPKIYEYFFMCSQSNNVIDYEIASEGKENIEKFIDTPYIELEDNEKIHQINIDFKKLEKKISDCKYKNSGYGTKLYKLTINANGEKFISGKHSSFSNKNLENCIDNQINKQSFPQNKKDYSIYFSIVISNIK
jgi:hypothetical protein